MNIPKEISGRKVTNRGVHSLPFPYHGDYMGNETARSYWLGLMQSMHMSWVVLLTDGDSVLQKYDGYSVYEHYLRAGMNPVIRYLATLPYPFFGQDMVRGLVREAEPYGVTPFVQLWNEPGDPREWKDKKVPANWWDVFVGLWNDAAGQVLDLGAYPGFPDGPGYNFTTKHPFAHADHWHEDGVWYAVHNYGKGRPLDYPYDPVSQYGTPLTMEEYRYLLDDFADDPAWMEDPLDAINKQREEWASENKSVLEDDACWLAFEKVDYHANDILGRSVPMIMTEGGWQPRDRAGSNPIDIRWPHTTPKMVANKTLAMFESLEGKKMIAQCPWLLGCSFMGGAGWEYDAWVGWPWVEKYGTEKPVIKMLQENPPEDDDEDVIDMLNAAADDIVDMVLELGYAKTNVEEALECLGGINES